MFFVRIINNYLHLLQIKKNMKKIIFFVAALGAFTFTSCKKDYTCTCKNNADGAVVSAATITNDTKKHASESCSQGTVSGTVTCSVD